MLIQQRLLNCKVVEYQRRERFILVEENVCDKQRSWPVLKYYPIIGSERQRKKKGSHDCTPQDKEWCPEPSKCKVALLITDTRNNTESGSLLDRLAVTN